MGYRYFYHGDIDAWKFIDDVSQIDLYYPGEFVRKRALIDGVNELDAFIDILREYATSLKGWLDQTQPIVRCQDCKFEDEPWNCPMTFYNYPNGFCSEGSIKEIEG